MWREYPLSTDQADVSNIVAEITSPEVIASAEGLWSQGKRHEGVFPPLGRLGYVTFRRNRGPPTRIAGVHPDGYMISVRTETSGLDVYTNRAFNHWAASYLVPRGPDVVAHYSRVWSEMIGTGLFERIYRDELVEVQEWK
jgi:hypothetical protein